MPGSAGTRGSGEARLVRRRVAIPTCRELAFVVLATFLAAPRLSRTLVGCHQIDELLCAIEVEIVLDPEFGPDLHKRYLAEYRTQVFIANFRCDAFAFQHILIMIDRNDRVGRRQLLHFATSASRNCIGSSERSRTSTSADPTIAPAACSPTAATSEWARIPNPAQTGSLAIADTLSR